METNKLDFLLALRAFACMTVVLTHCFAVIPSNMQANVLFFGNLNLTWAVRSCAWAGVWVFFCLSGYLMGKAFYSRRYELSDEGVLNFWKNRFLKIWPVYYFNLLILFAFISPDILRPINWRYIYASTPFNYDGSALYFPNSALWSVSTEFQFYLIVPFLCVIFYPRLKTDKQIVISIIVNITFALVLRMVGFFWQDSKPGVGLFINTEFKPLYFNLDLFITGFLLNVLVANNKGKIGMINDIINSNRILINILSIVIFYVIASFISYNAFIEADIVFENIFIFVLPPLTAIFSSFFIYINEVVVSHETQIRNKPISFNAIKGNPWRILEIYGLLTFGIYVWHGPIIQSTEKLFKADTPLTELVLRFVGVMALTTLFASITYIGIEKPAAKLKKFSIHRDARSSWAS